MEIRTILVFIVLDGGNSIVLRLSKLADYAAVILVRLGKRSELTTAAILARETGLSEPTVAKLLKSLVSSGLVASVRGARGGYHLAVALEDISVARVIRAIDGPICLAECCDGHECERGAVCGLMGQWDKVNRAMHQTLEAISLADMTDEAMARGANIDHYGIRRHNAETTQNVMTKEKGE